MEGCGIAKLAEVLSFVVETGTWLVPRPRSDITHSQRQGFRTSTVKTDWSHGVCVQAYTDQCTPDGSGGGSVWHKTQKYMSRSCAVDALRQGHLVHPMHTAAYQS